MNYTFSDRIASLKPSAIREILKFTSVPGVIPFAAGNPAAEAFPTADVAAITAKILAENPVTALQYGVTEGYAPLLEALAGILREKYHILHDEDGLMITAGAQQVVDLSTKILCNEGDTVICENPSFIGSLNCFRSYLCNLVGVEIEADGMNMEALESALKAHPNARFIYTIPNFQNPSGVTMSLQKRETLYRLARQYGVLILEDNPYEELRIAGETLPSIKSMDTDGIVIYAGSFSKILSPGLRVGYAVAPKALLSKMTVGKQAADVHTPVLNQMIVNEWLRHYDYEAHIRDIRAIYSRKLALMCDGIDREFGDHVRYVRPQGGLFVWCELPETVDMMDFCKRAVEHKVAVVPGTAFTMRDTDPTQCFRMNFSTPGDEDILSGIQILKAVLLTP